MAGNGGFLSCRASLRPPPFQLRLGLEIKFLKLISGFGNILLKIVTLYGIL